MALAPHNRFPIDQSFETVCFKLDLGECAARLQNAAVLPFPVQQVPSEDVAERFGFRWGSGFTQAHNTASKQL